MKKQQTIDFYPLEVKRLAESYVMRGVDHPFSKHLEQTLFNNDPVKIELAKKLALRSPYAVVQSSRVTK